MSVLTKGLFLVSEKRVALRACVQLSRSVDAAAAAAAAITRPSTPSACRPHSRRRITTSTYRKADSRILGDASDAKKEQTKNYDDLVASQKDKQTRTPWHREGSNLPPIRRPRSASAMTKGKLLTTPSRLLKLIIPLTTTDKNSDRKDVQPLALLVHPQQPLSYLERLIQSELPTIVTKGGQEKIPAVRFKAEDPGQDEIVSRRAKKAEEDEDEIEEQEEGETGDDEINLEGKIMRTGKISADANAAADDTAEALNAEQRSRELRGGPGEGGVEFYSGDGRDGPEPDHKRKLVKWSTSTDIGDFIRDAARGKEFAVEIEGAEKDIMIGVPSFGDRTHYLRTRLRKMSARISTMATIKDDCDKAAHQSAQRVAMGGFAGMLGWWVGVWYLTFQTSLGWDVMEPVTYLVGLSTLMGGYLWFLYHNREVSYRSALNLTVSRRQNTLYQQHGFELGKWERLVQDANSLRYEVKKIADEYDVEWDETQDEHDESVTKALKEERESNKTRQKEQQDDEEEEKNQK